MASALRVMVIDDSAVVRAILTDVIGRCPGLRVVAAESSAMAALHTLLVETVDIIVLDIEMPGMSGLVALPLLLERSAGARVVVLSANVAQGAAAAVDALALGATETMLKPRQASFTGSFGTELTQRLLDLGAPTGVRATPIALQTPDDGFSAQPAYVARERQVTALGIGASTGGIIAITDLLAAIPSSFAAPIFITQHLPAGFISYFVEQLTRVLSRPVCVATAGERVVAGTIYVAPGAGHMVPVRHNGDLYISIDATPTALKIMPAVDPMFSGLADACGAGAVAVVLTGMGKDGLVGSAAIRGHGGTVMVQDSASSVIWGMPGAVFDAGLADAMTTPVGLGKLIGTMPSHNEALLV